MNILLRPLVTEKYTKLGEKLKQYGFVVDKSANKLEIKNAVEKMYSVTVMKVATLRYAGKKYSRSTKKGAITGKKPEVKKAVVTVSAGDTIDFFSSV